MKDCYLKLRQSSYVTLTQSESKQLHRTNQQDNDKQESETLDFIQLSLFFHPRYLEFELTRVHDAPDGAEPHHVAYAGVSEVPVLPWPEVQHPASVVGLLEHQPVAVHHVAGLAVGHAVAVLDVVAVLHQLMTLALEVLPLVDPHPE